MTNKGSSYLTGQIKKIGKGKGNYTRVRGGCRLTNSIEINDHGHLRAQNSDESQHFFSFSPQSMIK